MCYLSLKNKETKNHPKIDICTLIVKETQQWQDCKYFKSSINQYTNFSTKKKVSTNMLN